MGQKETAVTNVNRIMIYGPKNDGTYIVEFKTADGEALAISVPRGSQGNFSLLGGRQRLTLPRDDVEAIG